MRPICLIFWALVLVASLLSMPCTLDALPMSFKRAEISASLSESEIFPMWKWSISHRDCSYTTLQCKMLCKYWKEGGKKSNINLSVSLFPSYSKYFKLTPVFSASFQQPVACWEIQDFQLNFTFLPSAFTLFNGHNHSLFFFFSCKQHLQLLRPSTGMSIALSSYWCLLFYASV